MQKMILENLLTPRKYNHKIRIGPNSDGGYVVSENHLGKRLISLGCENATKFEEEYLSINQEAEVVIYDGTSSCDLALKDSRVSFHNKNVYSLSELTIDKPCMMQIDIEGSELFLLNGQLDKLKNVEQLVMEIHFHKEEYPDFPVHGSFQEWVNLFKSLNTMFSLIHIHVNDNGIAQRRPKFFGMYDLLELTYIKKDDTLEVEDRHFPLENLDYPNAFGMNPSIGWWTKQTKLVMDEK